MIRINLIPPEYVERINRRALIAKAVLLAVVVVASVAILSLWHITREKTIESTLAKRTEELRSLQTEVDQVKAIEAQIAEVQRYLDSINKINKGRFLYTNFMKDLVGDLPATIWFTMVSTNLSGNDLRVTFAVSSNSAYDLAYWINYLETSGKYSEVGVGGIAVSDTESGRKLTVSIAVKYLVK